MIKPTIFLLMNIICKKKMFLDEIFTGRSSDGIGIAIEIVIGIAGISNTLCLRT